MRDGAAIIIPGCFQVPSLLDRFRKNLQSIRGEGVTRIIVVCNRLSLMTAESLEHELAKETPYRLQVIHEKERSVAGAWNRGIEIATDYGAELFLITAVDVEFFQDTFDRLVSFASESLDSDIWSSTAVSDWNPSRSGLVDACDFSCFVLRRRAIARYGWFDKEYKPAYFEDNDYIARVVLGGGSPKRLLGAQHRHEGSITLKMDPDMAHHVRHWYGQNAARFHAKWKEKTDDYHLLRRNCFSSPYNSGKAISWWPEQDRPGYSPAGGIHE